MHRKISGLQSLQGTFSSHEAQGGVSPVHHSLHKESRREEGLSANLYVTCAQEAKSSSLLLWCSQQWHRSSYRICIPLKAEILDFISQGGLLATSPPPLQTLLNLKVLFWRLKILPLPQQEELPSPLVCGQPTWVPLLAAGSSFHLSVSKGRTQLCFHTENFWERCLH